MKAREAAVKDRDAELDDRRGRLETLEQAERTELDSKAKVLAEDRVAFAKLEEKARAALKTLYEGVLEDPLAGKRTALPSCFPSWCVHLKMPRTALALWPRPRRVPCRLQR